MTQENAQGRVRARARGYVDTREGRINERASGGSLSLAARDCGALTYFTAARPVFLTVSNKTGYEGVY